MALSIGQPVNGATASRVLCTASDGTLFDDPSGLSPTFTGMTLTGATVSQSNSTNGNVGYNVTNSSNGSGAFARNSFTNDGGVFTSVGTFSSTYTANGVLLANRGALYNSGTVGIAIVAAGSGSAISFAVGAETLEQVRITHTASASRYLTLTGSNGGNPVIGTSAGDVNLSSDFGRVGSNAQVVAVRQLSELTTIAAAATTDTAIQIPANAIVIGVSVRVTTVIPTAATFTVIGTTSSTAFQTGASVSTAATTTDAGTKSCPYLNTTAQTIRITPNAQPADNSGRVRVTIHYLEITPPTS